MLFYPVFTIFVLQMFYEITGKIKSPKKMPVEKFTHTTILWQQ